MCRKTSKILKCCVISLKERGNNEKVKVSRNFSVGNYCVCIETVLPLYTIHFFFKVNVSNISSFVKEKADNFISLVSIRFN